MIHDALKSMHCASLLLSIDRMREITKQNEGSNHPNSKHSIELHQKLKLADSEDNTILYYTLYYAVAYCSGHTAY